MKPQLLIKEDINRIVFDMTDPALEKAITPDKKKIKRYCEANI